MRATRSSPPHLLPLSLALGLLALACLSQIGCASPTAPDCHATKQKRVEVHESHFIDGRLWLITVVAPEATTDTCESPE